MDKMNDIGNCIKAPVRLYEGGVKNRGLFFKFMMLWGNGKEVISIDICD